MHIAEPAIFLIKLRFQLVRGATVWISVCSKPGLLREPLLNATFQHDGL
jgi:hypothetical protein